MQKVKVIDKKSENSIKYERELLSRLHHPFIVNMHYAFQDYDHLYIVLDLLTGGDLRYHVSRKRKFSEEQTKFFIACLILSLEYIHSKRVIHRDIKPENLVLDDKGYVHLTDFGIAKVFSNKNSSETSGTPGYMAPEVMRAQNHTHAVDYFAIGVMGYEFMLGRRPYLGKSRKEIKELMMGKQACVKEDDLPYGWSVESADFINRLLLRKPEMRLGYSGIREVKEHPWFRDFPWEDLLKKRLNSPYVPEKKDNFDRRYCEAIEKIGIETKSRYEGYKNNIRYENLFHGFTFYRNDTLPAEPKPNIPSGTRYKRNNDSGLSTGNSINDLRNKTNLLLKGDNKGEVLDYSRKRRSASAYGNIGECLNRREMKKSHSNANLNVIMSKQNDNSSTNSLIMNRNQNVNIVSSRAYGTNPSGVYSHRSSHSINHVRNDSLKPNTIISSTKNVVYHHQPTKSLIPKSKTKANITSNVSEYTSNIPRGPNSVRPASSSNSISISGGHHRHYQSKIPIPVSKQTPRIGLISPYSRPIKNASTQEMSSIANRPSSHTYRKYSFGYTNRNSQSNSHSSFDASSIKQNSYRGGASNLSNNAGAIGLFKTYKMSSCSNHSTGNSSGSRMNK